MFHCFVNTFIYDKRSINFLPISKTHTHTFIYNIYSCIYTYTHTYIHTPSGNQTRQWKLPVNGGFPIAMFDCQRVCIHYTSLNTNHTPTWLLQKSFKIPAFYPTIHPLYIHPLYTRTGCCRNSTSFLGCHIMPYQKHHDAAQGTDLQTVHVFLEIGLPQIALIAVDLMSFHVGFRYSIHKYWLVVQ